MNNLSLPLIFVAPMFIYSMRLILEEFAFNGWYQKSYLNIVLGNRNIVLASVGLMVSLLLNLNLRLFLFLILLLIAIELAGKVHRAKRLRLIKYQILQQLPASIELLTVLVASGESPSKAISILGSRSSGAVSTFYRDVSLLLNNGVNLRTALDRVSSELEIADIRRFCDALVVATERGSALSEVLSRQVVEIRSKSHSRTLEKAGKAEISLMIPVVFLILPISVIFALWPSFVSLNQITLR
jgi:tight adherence protein C